MCVRVCVCVCVRDRERERERERSQKCFDFVSFFPLEWAMCSNMEKSHIKQYIIIIIILIR